MKSFWVILYTYNGYDGSVNELECDNDGKYIGYSSKEDAEKYCPKSNKMNEWAVVEVTIK